MKLRFLAISAIALLLSSCANAGDISSALYSSIPSSESVSAATPLSSQTQSLTSQPTSSNPTSLTSQITSQNSNISAENEYFPLPDSDSRWPLDFSEYGVAFRNRLSRLINSSGSKTTSYSSLNNVLQYSDASPTGSGVVPFYHSDSASTTNWNKEHVWPNSRGAGETGPGSDPQVIRPTKTSDNSARGNKFFGDVALDDVGNTWDPASLGFEGARGEAARIIFYAATRYYNTCGTGGSSKGDVPLSLTNRPDDTSAMHTMGRLDRLVEWNNLYPVTAQEIRRNNYLDNAGYARNPFIDHPEYVNWIWNKDGLRTSPVNTDPISSSSSLDSLTYRYNYQRIASEADLSSKVGIAGIYGNVNTYYAMSDQPKSSTLTYYINPIELFHDNGTFSTDTQDVALFKFNKQSNGNYTIQAGSKYLYHYIDGSHTSIGFDMSSKSGSGNEWVVTFLNNGEVTIKGSTNNVFLEYYVDKNGNRSFCGYGRAPSQNLILIQ